MTETHPDMSLSDVLVLLTIKELNDRKMVASDAAILSILDMTSLVTGVDLKCPEVLNPEAINEACKRLEALGYIADEDKKDTSEEGARGASDVTPYSLTAEEYEICDEAIRFSVEVMENLAPQQYEALFTLVLCRTVGRWEGWYEDGDDLLAMVGEKLPESLADAERGNLIAETMREIWDCSRRK